jgi:hypothetical protein
VLPWRKGLACILMVCFAFALPAQEKDLWRSFQFDELLGKTRNDLLATRGIPLDDGQISAIRKTLMARVRAQQDGWCVVDDGESWLDDLTFNDVPLNGRVRIVMATAGAGCARGAQGANGEMWLFQIQGQRLRFLGALGGWGMAIQPTEVDGFRDFVTGWHMSAMETELSYYRFDGKVYKQIAKASEISGRLKSEQSSPQK